MEQIGALKQMRSKLPRLKPGLTPKNQALMHKFEDPMLDARHLALPDELWQEAIRGGLPPYKAMVRAQLALAIAIEQFLALRSLNLIQLSFTKHLSWPAGPKAPALLRLDAEEMKNGQEHNAELPTHWSQRLLHYRDHLVPAALGTKSEILFVTRFGNAKSQRTLAQQTQEVILSRLGIIMSLHQSFHMSRIAHDIGGKNGRKLTFHCNVHGAPDLW